MADVLTNADISVTDVSISEDRQVMLWTDVQTGQRRSEHRSIGDTEHLVTDDVWVRLPRAYIDDFYVVCCALCSREKRKTVAATRRVVIVEESASRYEARDLAKQHAEAHRLARASFEIRRVVAYIRQRRLESDLFG